jgi:hypothetical protein
MHQIETKIEEASRIDTNIHKERTLIHPYAPRKICQLSSKEWKLQKSNHEYK